MVHRSILLSKIRSLIINVLFKSNLSFQRAMFRVLFNYSDIKQRTQHYKRNLLNNERTSVIVTSLSRSVAIVAPVWLTM